MHYSDAPKFVNDVLVRFMLNHIFRKVHIQPKTINHQIINYNEKSCMKRAFCSLHNSDTQPKTHFDAGHIRRTASVHAELSKVENDVLDGLMVNHIFHPVHLLPKSINYQIN